MIRVLRLIEYVYPDAQTAEMDMSRWSIPAIGTINYRTNCPIRSTILTNLDYKGEETNETKSEQQGN